MFLTPIEKILIEELPSVNRWKRKKESLDFNCYTEDFDLFDEKACHECMLKGFGCTDKSVARFSIKETAVFTYSLEEYLLAYCRYKKAQGCKCDFLHIDAQEKRFVLNELTCSAEKYVNPFSNTKGLQDGKRIHAKNQMTNVIQLFSELVSFKEYVSTFSERIALFSWRIPGEPVNEAEKSMSVFLQPQQLVSDITVMDTMDYEFKFVQQIYPSVFVFD